MGRKKEEEKEFFANPVAYKLDRSQDWISYAQKY